MTDMRATERLLEVIEEVTRLLGEQRIWATISSEFSTTEHGDRDETHRMVSLDQQVLAIKEAITELRRRGDTLVRYHDLRLVVEFVQQNGGIDAGEFDTSPTRNAAFARLKNAIGGKP